MPTTSQDYQKIQQMQEKSQKLIGEAGGLESSASTFEDRVMDRVRKARAQEGLQGLSEDIGRASETLVESGPNIRQRMSEGTAVNPMRVDVETAQARGANLGQLAAIGSAKQRTQGTISDIIGAGTNQLKAAAAKKKAEATRLSQEADDMINLINLKRQRQQDKFDRWYKKQQLQLKKQKLEQQGAGLTPSSQVSLLKWLSEQQQEQQAAQGNKKIAQQAINDIETSLESITQGPWAGAVEKAESIIPFGLGDPSLRKMNNAKERLFGLSKELMQLGRLSDKDVQIIKKNLPSAFVTKEENEKRIQRLRDTVENKFSGARGNVYQQQLEAITGLSGGGTGEWEIVGKEEE